MKDYIHPFMLADHSSNGRFVQLKDSATSILKSHNYPDYISSILSDLMIISCFLGQNLKNQGIITVQIRCNDGVLKLAVAEYSYGGNIRACANFDQENKRKPTFQELVGSAQMLITVESGGEKYQGIIDISEGIAESFKNYLEQSEQIKSEVLISSSVEYIFDEPVYKASGLIIKKMPNKSLDSEDDWERISFFVNSIKPEELTSNDSDEILRRLFHSDGVISYEKLPVHFKCRCSREKMEMAINSIPKEELESYKINGKISIKCEFCLNEELF